MKNIYNKAHKTEWVPYTYVLTHKSSGKKYYGSRFAKGCHPSDLFVFYFTSSKHIHALIDSGGVDSFTVEIRKTFSSVKECTDWEFRVLKRLKVRSNPNWINKDDCQRVIDNTGRIFISNPSTGECIRIKHDSIIPDGWVRGNVNAFVKNPGNSSKRIWCYDPKTLKEHHVEPHEVLPHWIHGRLASNKETLKNKNMKWYTNGIESRQIGSDEIIPEGWYKGRVFKTKPKGSTPGFKWINDGVRNTTIKKDEPIPDGWVRGMLR